MELSLDKLKIGNKAIIVSISGEQVPTRFYEMGLIPGEILTITGKAPFQGPISVSIGDKVSVIALRKREAGCIIVQPYHD